MSLLKILLMSAVALSIIYELFKIYLNSGYSDYELVTQMADREVAQSIASIVRFLILGAGIYFL